MVLKTMNCMYFTLRYWTHIYRDCTFSKSGCFHYYVDFAWKRTTFSYFNRCLCPVRSYSTVVAAALSCSGVCPGQLLEWSHRDVWAVPHWKLHRHWRTDGMYAMWGRANHTTAWSNTVLWWVWPFIQRNACGEKKWICMHGRSKHRKGWKECYLLGQNTICNFFG